jgi:hypothetical protein
MGTFICRSLLTSSNAKGLPPYLKIRSGAAPVSCIGNKHGWLLRAPYVGQHPHVLAIPVFGTGALLALFQVEEKGDALVFVILRTDERRTHKQPTYLILILQYFMFIN